MDDIGRLSIAQESLIEADHRTTRRNGRSHSVVRFPALQLFSLWMTTFGWYRRDTEMATRERRSIATGDVQHAGERPTGHWWCSADKAHAAPLGLCDNLINALLLLTNQQKDRDSPIQSIVTGLHKRSSRGIMDGLRRFIQPDNRSAVDVGDLRGGTKSLPVNPEATITERAVELTLRADEVVTQRKTQFSEVFSGAIIREGAERMNAAS